MKVSVVTICCILAMSMSAPVPAPQPFLNLGAVAFPSLTGSALIDGLLLGKVAFVKAALLANLLLGADAADEASGLFGSSSELSGDKAPVEEYGPPSGYGAPTGEYGAPTGGYAAPGDGYGAPADGYGAPVEEYGAPSYDAPAPVYDAGVQDTYGAPVSQPLPTYNNAPTYPKF